MRKPRGFFVIGTDTGVGKTHISCALLLLLKELGLRTTAIKPISTGGYNDAEMLQKHMTETGLLTEINPFAFKEPVAPHIAALKEKRILTVKKVKEACSPFLKSLDTFHIIEGVGGLLVPLNEKETLLDLIRSFGLPVILVVGMRLGCLNHALLTFLNLQAASIKMAGWIANSITNMPYLSENIEMLKKHLVSTLLGVVPYQADLNVHVTMQYLDVRLLELSIM